MMRAKQGLFTIAMLASLTLLPPQQTHAAMAAPTQQQVIDRFIAYSSYDPQFERLPQMVQALLERNYPDDISSAQHQELTTRLLASFEAEQTRQAMTQQLSLGYDSGRYRALIQKLENGSIRKLRDMERAIYEPITSHEMKYFIAHLPDNPVPPKREALIKALLAANGAIESAVNTRTTLHQMVRDLLNNGVSEKNRVSPKETFEQNRILAESLRPVVESETLAIALYTYRNASDGEIRQYIDFYNSPAGQWFNQTQQNGWLGALRNIGRDIAWKMQQPELDDMQTAFGDELELEL